ncbi:MAG: 30S ribosomal protein S20 [Bacteroidaceae bacterium]|nr:30S ribosomal protein S20 [Bacteroidaceae bacterium]
MKRTVILLFAATLLAVPSQAQLLNRLTEKAVKAAEKGVEKAVTKSVEKTTEKAAEKALGAAEKAVDAQVNKGVSALNQSTNELNASIQEANRVNDSILKANGMQAQAGLGGLVGSYMTLMGAGTPTYEDKGNEVLLSWDYVGFKLEWLAKFRGDNCSESKLMYTFQTPELATQYYREQTADLEKDEAKLWSVKDKTVTQDNTAEYKGQDKITVKAAMQQIVLSMGGKLE